MTNRKTCLKQRVKDLPQGCLVISVPIKWYINLRARIHTRTHTTACLHTKIKTKAFKPAFILTGRELTRQDPLREDYCVWCVCCVHITEQDDKSRTEDLVTTSRASQNSKQALCLLSQAQAVFVTWYSALVQEYWTWEPCIRIFYGRRSCPGAQWCPNHVLNLTMEISGHVTRRWTYC